MNTTIFWNVTITINNTNTINTTNTTNYNDVNIYPYVGFLLGAALLLVMYAFYRESLGHRTIENCVKRMTRKRVRIIPNPRPIIEQPQRQYRTIPRIISISRPVTTEQKTIPNYYNEKPPRYEDIVIIITPQEQPPNYNDII